METPTYLTATPQDAGKREKTKLRNRRIILEAAKQVFARMGFEAASVRDIIHATDLASGTFYNYFRSKEDIYRAIYDEAAKTIRPQLHAARLAATTAEEYITTCSRLYFDYIVREWKEYYQLRCGLSGERVRFEASEVIAAYDELKVDIAEAARRGIFPDTDIEFLTAALIGITQEVASTMLSRKDCDPVAASEFVSAFVLKGVMAVPAKS